MNKKQLVMKLIKTCSKYDIENYDSMKAEGEENNHFENVILYRALYMLTNKQIIKLINSVK